MWQSIKKRFKYFLLRNYTHLYGLFHGIERKILFISFAGKQYSDNPRAISEKVHELYPDFDIVWGLYPFDDVYHLMPSYVRTIAPNTLAYYKELATAKYFFTNEAIETNIFKRKGQYFVQTWHGDRGFKKILYEVWEEKNEKRPVPIVDNDVTDLFIVGSDYGSQRAKDAFHYYGEQLCVGMPRNDKLINPSQTYIDQVKKKLGIEFQDKILLYAPTFRDSSKQSIDVDLDSVIEHLNNKGEGNWICLLRSHSLSGGFVISKEIKHKYIDVTNYPDMADMLLISDILLSDYSSCSGDFILKDKPVILLHYDLEEYNSRHRNFRISPKDAGYLCVNNDKELLDLLDNLNDEIVEKECSDLKKFFGIKETGNATDLVCKKVFKEN